MRIGIDGSCWTNRRGFGRFTRCLVTEMTRRRSDHEVVLVIDEASSSGATIPDGIEVWPVAVSAPPSEAITSDGSRTIADVLRMSRAVSRSGCDVFFFPASYSYYPVWRVPVVVTIHDAIAERLPKLVTPSWRGRALWRLKHRLALRQSRQVLTVSEASRTAIEEMHGVSPDRLHVIREAPDQLFRPLPTAERDPLLERFDLTGGTAYLLYVGGISPHKNLGVLIDAFGLIAADHDDLLLVLVGDLERDPFLSSVDDVRRRAAASPASDRIHFTGYVSDEELVALYSAAVALVHPSLQEGFGLTPAEAAACGVPVVSSADPALEELLGHAAVYADASDPTAFATHIRRLLEDAGHREEMSRRSLALSRSWSWEAAADTTLDLLAQVGDDG